MLFSVSKGTAQKQYHKLSQFIDDSASGSNDSAESVISFLMIL
jgi:hypothetical protein